MELTTVADDEAVAHDGTRVLRLEGLESGHSYELGGLPFTTFAPRGQRLATVATVNDVHIGETRCGVIDGTDVGPVLSSAPGEEPYPEMMNRCVVAEIEAVDPDAVVVKGDLTADGSGEQFRRFEELYSPLASRLTVVRGNHDSYGGATFASEPTQEVVVDGLTVAVLDTARRARAGGDLSAEQLEWLDELATRTDQPVLVLGHHHCWNPDVERRSTPYFGIAPEASEALLDVLGRRRNVLAYAAGHTHRNEVRHPRSGGGSPIVQVASVKDYPGSWVEYRVYEGTLLQVHRRCSAPEALVWTEATRHMYDGAYAEYAFGDLSDRCWSIDVPGV